MPEIALGVSNWSSLDENVPGMKVRNLYKIDNPASPTGTSFVSRPTLSEVAEIGDGPIYAMWRQDATFNGDWLVVSGEELFRFNPTTLVDTLIGSLPGTSFCQFSATGDRAIIVRDGVPYSTDGTALTVVVMPDDVPGYIGIEAPVSSVACINSTFLLSVEGIDRFYWIDPGATDPDPLDFATAERIPDAIEAVAVLTDEIWFIGTQGPEVWTPTGDAEVPFQRTNGRVYNEGCASRYTVASCVFSNNPCLLWVTGTRTVVLAQGTVQKVSDEAVEEKLKTATNLRAWTFRHRRHDFYVLCFDEGTLIFDLQKGMWSAWDTYLQDTWRAHVGFQSGSDVFSGDATTGKVFQLTEDTDDDGDRVIREVTGVVPVTGKSTPCNSISVRVNAGWSPTYGFSPNLEVRWSDDQGVTWADYVMVSLGDKGKYSQETVLRSLGRMAAPGRLFEFRFAEKARFRLDYAMINEV